MEEIVIPPVDKQLLKSELTPSKQLRLTNKSNNEIYIVTAQDSPNVMREIGRLREIAFRNLTRWKVGMNNSLCGILMPKILLGAIVFNMVPTGK